MRFPKQLQSLAAEQAEPTQANPFVLSGEVSFPITTAAVLLCISSLKRSGFTEQIQSCQCLLTPCLIHSSFPSLEMSLLTHLDHISCVILMGDRFLKDLISQEFPADEDLGDVFATT